jgi:pseudouridine kinase
MKATGFVLVVGGANLDVSATTDQILEKGDSTPGRVEFSPGGVARNVAENLARLGHDARLVSAVGDDMQGAGLLHATQRAGVDVQGCLRVAGRRTATYVAVHGADGDMVVAVNDMNVLDSVDADSLAHHAESLRQSAALVVDCNLPEAALAWLFAHAGSAPVFVDAVSAFKCRRVLPWLAQVHTLKVNRLEAQALSGLPVESDAQVQAASQCLHRQGVRRVVVSLGAQGLFYSDVEGEAGWLAAWEVHVRNTTGAGDALMAGLVHGHLAGEPLHGAARFANACAALTLTADAANHPELGVARVEHMLRGRGGG